MRKLHINVNSCLSFDDDILLLFLRELNGVRIKYLFNEYETYPLLSSSRLKSSISVPKLNPGFWMLSTSPTDPYILSRKKNSILLCGSIIPANLKLNSTQKYFVVRLSEPRLMFDEGS